MKVGSWYISEGGLALGEYIETRNGTDVFSALVYRKAAGDIVKHAAKPSFSPCPAYDIAKERTLWTKQPTKKRGFVEGDKIFAVENGNYTAIPRLCLFNRYFNDDSCVVKRVIDMSAYTTCISSIRSAKYLECDRNCRNATLTWLLVSKRIGLPKDLRRLIGEYVWETREDRKWERTAAATATVTKIKNKKMKVGSLYILHREAIVVRYMEPRVPFMRDCLQYVYCGVTGEIENVAGVHYTGACGPMDLWPRISAKRQWVPRIGQKVLIIVNGTFTGIPMYCIVQECLPPFKTCIAYQYDDEWRERKVKAPLCLVRPRNYAFCIRACKDAVFCLLVILKRLRVVKDMRTLIGQHVWYTRDDSEWDNQQA